MGIKRTIKDYLKRKEKIKLLNTESVVNFDQYIFENKSIVFLSKTFPTHDKDSGSNRLKEIILQFKELGYNCIICVEKTFEDNSYVQFYKENDCIVYVESRKFKNVFEFLKSLKKIDFYWYNGAETFNVYFKKTKRISPKATTIYDMVDIHFLRIKRALELNQNSKALKKDYKKFFEIETELSEKADKIIAISENENIIMQEFLKKSKIITISNIHYPKIKIVERKRFEERKDLIFIGSVHEPNIDAIEFLYSEIMPNVWRFLPDVRVNIIGNVAEKIDKNKYGKFNITGFVPDIKIYFEESKLMVAPLRYGAGVKGKIGQAFEYYLPVVTTQIGAEGMNIENGKNAMVENDPKKFAEAIVKVYTEENLWEILSTNSENSLKPFSLEQISEQLKKF